MALRDHSLDEKIVQAAREEFLKYGFQKASLHKIAEKAGITTGALYTRYKSKDDLFSSLVKASLSKIGMNFEPIRKMYMDAHNAKDPDLLLQAIQYEKKIYLDVLFQCYDDCVLFFCRSGGSSIEVMMQEMMAQKVQQTLDFIQSMAKKEVNLEGIDFILSEQFHYYREILERGYDKERAVSCMEAVGNFLEAGWKDLFERIL